MVPDCSPVFRKSFEISVFGKPAHTSTGSVGFKAHKFSGMDGKPTTEQKWSNPAFRFIHRIRPACVISAAVAIATSGREKAGFFTVVVP